MVQDIKKKRFLLISSSPDRLTIMEEVLKRHYFLPTIYRANNGYTGQVMIQNSPVDVIFFDSMDFVPDEFKLIDFALSKKDFSHTSFILVGHYPIEDEYIDELLNGRIVMVEDRLSDVEFSKALATSLNYNSHSEPASFYLKYVGVGENLIKEGDKGLFIYILKSGKLQAYTFQNGNKVILGDINEGEFVGEMAYINNEPRSASIEALVDSELIEIPIGIVDKILFKKPSWARTLMKTLTKRIKISNLKKIQSNK